MVVFITTWGLLQSQENIVQEEEIPPEFVYINVSEVSLADLQDIQRQTGKKIFFDEEELEYIVITEELGPMHWRKSLRILAQTLALTKVKVASYLQAIRQRANAKFS